MNRYAEEDKLMSENIAKEFGEGWLPPDPTIEIKKPKAFPGDQVVFSNKRKSRMKAFDDSDIGIVKSLHTEWISDNEYLHIYSVLPTGRKNLIQVTEVQKIKFWKKS